MESAKSIDELLADLYRRQIRISERDGRLKVTGPEDVIDADLNATLKTRKAEIIAYLRAHAGGASSTIERLDPRPDPLPLSFAQHRLWFLEQMQPGSAAYNLPMAVEVEGQLDTDALRRAMQAIVDRHEVLRTHLKSKDGEPRQWVASDAGIDMPIVDLSDALDPATSVREAARKDALTAFDLAGDLPLRIKLYRISSKRWVVLFTLHHIAADAWSLEILLRELGELYPACLLNTDSALPELPIQYADFSVWQRSESQAAHLETELAYWRGKLAGELPRLQLPADFPRPRTQTFTGNVVEFSVSAATTEQLRAIGSQHGASLFMTLLGAVNVLLYRYSGQQDLLVGTPVANRHRAEVENLIGLFVNTLVIRTGVEPARGFGTLLEQVRETTLAAYDHQDLPFEHLVEDLSPERDPSVSPLFQVKFRLENRPAEHLELPGITLTRLPQQVSMAKLDLSIDMYETPTGLVGGFEYNSDLFKGSTVQRMAEQFAELLTRIAADPAAPVGELSVLTKSELQRQQTSWNASSKPYREDTCYHHLFEQQARETPDAVAAVFDDGAPQELSYAELNQRANRVAHALIAQGVLPEQVVAICIERSLEMVIALLGVLKAGGAYLPLDANYPAERLEFMLKDAGVQMLLSTSEIDLPAVAHRINLDTAALDAYPDDNPPSAVVPDNLAYLIYTSGSTGVPKGVLVPHRGLINLTEDKIRKCDVRPGDCVLQFFSFSFDGSVPEFVMTLAVGARLLLAPATTMLPGPGLRDLMQRNRVTHVTITPSALTALPQADYPELRMVLVGGEAPSPELIQRWSAGGRHFINGYGPTEATVNASMVHCGNGEPLEPTLLPSANKQLYILDEDLQIVPVGAVGELHIGGVGIARGYLHQPAMTAERFIPNPFAAAEEQYPAPVLYKSGDLAAYQPDGRIRLLGRIDQQTKLRGFRIELGEIERALEQHPQVRVGQVIIREHAGDKRLVAYAVADGEATDSGADIRRFLAEKLPQFMVPAAFAWLPELPLTSNGKLDVDALPIPEESSPGHKAPRNETEKLLTSLFAEILSLDSVGIDDNFFDLGGHSLLATRLVARLMEQRQVDITVLDLFDAPTVAGLAHRIEQKQHLGKLLADVQDDEDREEIAL